VNIDRTYSLSQAGEAQKAVAEGHVKGKLVIEIEPAIRERS
jgi:NADPH:quinone reductase-like Zn-dependent oxidoreductase